MEELHARANGFFISKPTLGFHEIDTLEFEKKEAAKNALLKDISDQILDK
jgi:hypothetical protein